MPRIALIGTSMLSVEPVTAAFRESWPEATLFNLLDDALLVDLNAAGKVTQNLSDRIGRLAEYAQSAAADGILYTCTAFGAAIDRVKPRLPIPILKPNEAMWDRACELGPRIGLLATTAPALPTMRAELEEVAKVRGIAVAVVPRHVPGALDDLMGGRAERHDDAIVAAARELADCDVILLGQFSMARAARRTAEATGRPVLTSPGAAVERLKRVMAG